MKKLAVIGYPIEHSLSPAMHTAALQEAGVEGFVYEKVSVEPEKVEGFVKSIREGEYVGANVTIPHKVAVIPFLDDLTQEAELIGAVNTIYFDGDKLMGHNTDGVGCLRALQEAGVEVAGKNILVLGAGGASRAITFTLAINKVAKLAVVDLFHEAAMNLAREVSDKVTVEIIGDDVKNVHEYAHAADIIINCTPLGMKGEHEGKSVLSSTELNENQVVMDIVYNPKETKLLQEAETAGCVIVYGIGMFVHQGAVGFEIWTGKKAPIDTMKKTVEEALQ